MRTMGTRARRKLARRFGKQLAMESARRMPRKQCPVCGKPAPVARQHKFCSGACHVRYQMLRRAAGLGPASIQLTGVI
jgi:hypothetical protein